MNGRKSKQRNEILSGVLGALFLAVCTAAGCSSSSDNPTSLCTAEQYPMQYSRALDTELARLEEVPVPDGADPAVFAALKSELASALRKRGDDRIVSAPPMLPGSSAYLSWDSDTTTLSWGYKCTGDYNQDSLVGVNDITPLGQNYLAEVPGDPNSMLAVVDGNGDRLITVNDITQIGQNYGARVTAYNVYGSSALSDYPVSATSGNGGAALLGSVPFPEGPPPQGQRRSFSFTVSDPHPETYFWVRPTDGTSEGTPSSYYYFAAPANIPPVASLMADPLAGDPPLLVSFDASLSHDPDGEIVKYEWDWDGMQNGYEWYDSGTTATVEHTFEEVGTFGTVVRLTDNAGAMDTASVEIIVTAPVLDPPVAVLTADPAWGEPPLTVNFSAEGSYDPDGTIEDYEWDLDGDGQYGEPGNEADADGIATADFTYTEDGLYTACVKVIDNDGANGMASVDVSVSSAGRGDWWMFGHDPQHTHRSPYVGAQTNNVKWSYEIDFGAPRLVESSPAIGADGTVYVGCYNRNLYAINPGGSLKWSYTTGGMIPTSSPAIGVDGTVYVGSDDDNLYAINPDGSLKWAYTTGGSVRSSPAIGADGMVYVGGGDNLYAFNPDGSLKWSYATGGTVRSSPAIGADGTLYVGSFDCKLHAIKPDGTLKWSYATDLKWLWSSPAIGVGGTVYVGSLDGKLHAINPDGSLKWSYNIGAARSSPTIGADGTVYVGSYDGNLYAINPNGSLKWSYATGGQVHSSPAIGADGTVYVGSEVGYAGGKLWAFGP